MLVGTRGTTRIMTMTLYHSNCLLQSTPAPSTQQFYVRRCLHLRSRDPQLSHTPQCHVPNMVCDNIILTVGIGGSVSDRSGKQLHVGTRTCARLSNRSWRVTHRTATTLNPACLSMVVRTKQPAASSLGLLQARIHDTFAVKSVRAQEHNIIQTLLGHAAVVVSVRVHRR